MSGIGPVPLDDPAGLIEQRVHANEKPAILSVGSAQSRLALARPATSEGSPPRGHQAVHVIWVYRGRPAPVPHQLCGVTHEVEIVLVEELGGTVRPRRPRERGNRVDDLVEVALARVNGLLGALPVVDIDQEDVPAGDVPVGVTHGQRAHLEPAIDAIGTAAAMLDIVGGSGPDRARKRGDHARQVIWMHRVAELPRFQLLDRSAKVFQELSVEMFHLTRRSQGRGEPGNAVDDLAEIDLTRPQGLHGPLQAFGRGGELGRPSRDPLVQLAGAEAIHAVLHRRPDLLFLDVQMPGGNGFEVLSELPADAMPLIVFVTAYDRYSLQAFEVHAVDYLLKPFSDRRFRGALAHAKERLSQRQAPRSEPAVAPAVERIAIRSSRGVLMLATNDIDWIEARGDYARIHSRDRTDLVRESLSSLESRLGPSRFVRIHRSAIVNLGRVREIRPDTSGAMVAVLLNGQTCRLSRQGRQRLADVLALSL